jgi:hypothetical protein
MTAERVQQVRPLGQSGPFFPQPHSQHVGVLGGVVRQPMTPGPDSGPRRGRGSSRLRSPECFARYDFTTLDHLWLLF